MSRLFDPLQLRSLKLRNRIVMSPMCQYSSTDGFADNWHLVHLGTRAVGGASLIITEAAAVNPAGRISYADLGIWKDEHIPKLKEITDFIKSQSAVAGIQLAHAGRKASKSRPWEGNELLSPNHPNGWQTVAPSAIPYDDGEPKPHELTKDEILQLINDFKSATLRSLNAGFQTVELHGAHGYLIHSFLSPITNKRSDEYGGSFENRIRFLLEITHAVRSVWPDDLPLLVRLSCTDWVDDDNSWDIDQSVKLAKELKNLGVDMIDCSSGGLVPFQNIQGGAGYQTSFAEKIKKEAGIATMAVGLIASSSQADHIIRTDQADMVALAREFLRNPYFPLHASIETRQAFEWPDQYKRGKP